MFATVLVTGINYHNVIKETLICHHLLLDVTKKDKYKLHLYYDAKSNSTLLIGTDAINACQNTVFISNSAFTLQSKFKEL